MPWQDAVEPTPQGFALLLEVRPGAKRAAFPDGFNAWRGRIGIAVTGPAQEGRANADVVGAVAGFFGVPARDVVVAAGATDRRKRVEVAGMRPDAARAALEAVL